MIKGAQCCLEAGACGVDWLWICFVSIPRLYNPYPMRPDAILRTAPATPKYDGDVPSLKLFIANVSFDATDEQYRTYFETFGEVHWATCAI